MNVKFLVKNSAIAQGLLVLGDQSFRSASTFLSAMLVGRACGPVEYGFYTLLLTLLVTAEAFQAAIVSTPYVVQSPSRAGHDKEVHLGNAVAIQLLMATVTAVVLLGLLHIFPLSGTDQASPWIVPAFALAYFAVLLREFFRQVLLADLEVGWNLAFGAAVHGSLIAALLGLTLAGRLNAGTAYAAVAGGSLLPTLLGLWFKRRHVRFDMGRMVRQFLEYWHVGRWLFAQAAIVVVSGPVYSWVLASSRGAAAVGLLGACLLPGSLLSPLVQAMNAWLLPKASHAFRHGIHHVRWIVLVSSVATGLTLIAFPVVLGWFSAPIMKLLFAGKYDPSGWLVGLLALRTYVIVTSVPLSVGLIVFEQTYAVFKSEMVSLILTVFIGLPLTCMLGVWGVAWGFLITRLFSRVYLALAFRQYVRASLCLVPAVVGTSDKVRTLAVEHLARGQEDRSLDTFASYRLTMWDHVLRDYRASVVGRGYAAGFRYDDSLEAGHAHNSLVELYFNVGLLGVVTWLFFLGTVYHRLYRLVRSQAGVDYRLVSIAGVAIFMLVKALASTVFVYLDASMLIMAGIVIYIVRRLAIEKDGWLTSPENGLSLSY